MTGSDDTQAPARGAAAAVLYGLNDPLPWPQTILIAFQHLLAMFVGTITPATIVSRALNLPFDDRAYLINMSLVASGTGTLLQVMSFRGFGSGLLSITGTSFAFIAPIIAAGKTGGGLSLVFGMSLSMAVVPLALAPFLPRLQRAFSPVVAGTIVLLIGLLLIPTSMFGIETPLPGGGSPVLGLAAAGTVLALVVGLNALRQSWARLSAALVALLGGYLLCLAVGGVQVPAGGAWFALPRPLKYGLSFDPGFILPFGFIYLVTSIETLGDLTASSELSGEPTSGPVYWRRVRGGVFADGVNCALAALLNCFPSTTFAQNNGVIQMTGVANRRVGYVCGWLLVGFGVLPGLGRWLASIPPPVTGGLTLVLFGLIAAAGIRILTRGPLGNREFLVVAVSLGVGLGVELHPEALKPLPVWMQQIFSSGISTGGLMALGVNLLLPRSLP